MKNELQSGTAIVMMKFAICLHIVPAADVAILQNGNAIAGDTSFSLSCCVTLPQEEEELIVEILTPVTIKDTDYSVNQMNESVIDDNYKYTAVLQFTTLKTSYGGEYTCTVAVNTSTFNATTIVNVQSKFCAWSSLQLNHFIIIFEDLRAIVY